MGDVTVTWIGDKELELKLKEIEKEAFAILKDAVSAGGEIVRKDASRRAPRRTGRLAESIAVKDFRKTKSGYTVNVGPGKDAWYGRLVETGHRIVRGGKQVGYRPARPFLRPALDENESAVQNAIAEHIRKAILEVVR